LPPFRIHPTPRFEQNHFSTEKLRARQGSLIVEPIWAVGLMTGTVLDGNIDVALIKTNGERIEDFGTYRLMPYPQSIRSLLETTLTEARSWDFAGPEPSIFAEAEDALTRAQSAAVRELVEGHGMTMADIGIVGFHGQTVLHRAPQPGRLGQTRQLGDGELMHSILGTRVAYDFRSADVRAGGQGAPLAAAYHAALMRNAGAGGDMAVLNLGGVANITWWDGEDNFVAFDTGPANAPLNDFIRAKGLGEMDRDGALGKAGTVDEARLAELLRHPYLTKAYPKSLDRFDFTAAMADGLNAEDGAALLTAFTAAAVGKALDLLPRRPGKLVVSGGGRHNPTMMAMLAERARVEVILAESLGWSGDAVEAECFAFLAVRVLRGLPISFPSTTGVPQPMRGGRLAG
jgi:anhydro-N-acetylmuramic acid kinase